MPLLFARPTELNTKITKSRKEKNYKKTSNDVSLSGTETGSGTRVVGGLPPSLRSRYSYSYYHFSFSEHDAVVFVGEPKAVKDH